MFKNRRWLILPAEEVKNININEILESSIDSLRYSVDKSKVFVKYDIIEYLTDETTTYFNPETMESETKIIKAGIYGRPSIYKTDYPEYNHDEIIQILSTSEWTPLLENKE